MPYTLQDLVAHIMDSFDLSDDKVDLRRAKRAAIDGFYAATNRREWAAYNVQQEIVLPAAVTEGTIDVTTAGVVTRAGYVWPSDVTDGELIIGDRAFEISERTSDTEIKITGWPSSETEDDASYTLVYGAFLLAANVRMVYDAFNVTDECEMDLVAPRELRSWKHPDMGTRLNQPYMASYQNIMVDGVMRTRMRVWPYPQNETKISLEYVRNPETPRWLHDLGECDISADGVVTTANDIPLGSIDNAWLRVSDTTGVPEADIPHLMTDPVLTVWEGEVTARDGTNEVTAPGAPESTNVGAILTSVLDCPSYLHDAIRLHAEASYKRTRNIENRPYLQAKAIADEAVQYAMEQDSVVARTWRTRTRQRGGRLHGHDVSVAE